MELQNRVAEKEELLKKVSEEINARREQISKMNSEIEQLETQGLLIQGALLAYQEMQEETLDKEKKDSSEEN